MANCTRCGATIDDYSGSLCTSCQSAQYTASDIGTPKDVPCQRCGMYLPPTELRMWNSRLYCSYCIMDIQDDERRVREAGKERTAAQGGAGKAPDKFEPQGISRRSGVCERCGRSADTLYTVMGRNICAICYNEEGGGAPQDTHPSLFGQIVVRMKKAVGLERKQPKIIALEKKESAQGTANKDGNEVFSIKDRRMEKKK